MWRDERKSPEHAEYSAGQERKETGRLENLSDGVFAIAMTLLVLSIAIPTRDQLTARHVSLQTAVLSNTAWLPFVTYIVSFLTILVMWINHHYMFQFLARVDRAFVVLNGLLLMVVVFVNYPTALVANFAGTSDGQFAVIAYNVTFTVASVLYNAMWFRIVQHGRLLVTDADPVEVASYSRQYLFGAPIYPVALAVAFINPALSVALDAAVAIFWAFTGKIIRTQVSPRERPHALEAGSFAHPQESELELPPKEGH